MDDSGNGIFQSIRFWQGWALAATAAALFTFVANAEFPVAGHTPDYVALVGDDPNAPLWVVNADLKAGTIGVRSPRAKPAPAGERYALWLVAGESTRRLFALPVSRRQASFKLPSELRALAAHRRMLGVATEPVDAPATAGAPADAKAQTEEPTPEWRWQAAFARL